MMIFLICTLVLAIFGFYLGYKGITINSWLVYPFYIGMVLCMGFALFIKDSFIHPIVLFLAPLLIASGSAIVGAAIKRSFKGLPNGPW